MRIKRGGNPSPQQLQRRDSLAKKGKEMRVGGPVEVRQTEGSDLVDIEGHATTWDQVYVLEDWYGEYEEVVAAGAADKTLEEGADVRLMVNHDGLPLARTKSGTLELEADDIGLRYFSALDGTDPDVQRIVPKLARKDLAESSMMFRVVREEWYFADSDDEDDLDRRTILEFKLYDVGPVTWPGNPTTDAGLASLRSLGPEALAGLACSLRAGNPLTACDRKALRALATDLAQDEEAPPDSGGITEEEGTERDTGSTLSLDMAQRDLEIIELESVR